MQSEGTPGSVGPSGVGPSVFLWVAVSVGAFVGVVVLFDLLHFSWTSSSSRLQYSPSVDHIDNTSSGSYHRKDFDITSRTLP